MVFFKMMRDFIKRSSIQESDIVELWYGKGDLPKGKGFKGRIMHIEIQTGDSTWKIFTI